MLKKRVNRKSKPGQAAVSQGAGNLSTRIQFVTATVIMMAGVAFADVRDTPERGAIPVTAGMVQQ